MTRLPIRFITADISQSNEVIHLGAYRFPMPVAARSTIIPREGLTTWTDLLPQAAAELMSLRDTLGNDGELMYFAFNEVEQPDNRIVRYKGYRQMLELESFTDNDTREASIVIESDDGIRFAALVPLADAKRPTLEVLVDRARVYHGFSSLTGSLLRKMPYNRCFMRHSESTLRFAALTIRGNKTDSGGEG